MAEIIAHNGNELTIQVTIKPLTVACSWSAMFIKLQKAAEFIALWNTMRELSGVQRQSLPNNCRINMPT